MKGYVVNLISQDLSKGGVKIPIFMKVRDLDVVAIDRTRDISGSAITERTKSTSHITHINKYTVHFTKSGSQFKGSITLPFKVLANTSKVFVRLNPTKADHYRLFPCPEVVSENSVRITLTLINSSEASSIGNEFDISVDLFLDGEYVEVKTLSEDE